MAPPAQSKAQRFRDVPYNPADPNHDEYGIDLMKNVKHELNAYASRNAAKLGLRPNHRISVRGFHPAFRVAHDGQLLIEIVAQFAQRANKSEVEKLYGKDKLGGVPLRGGTTVIASADGRIRYVISKPLPSPRLRADQRRHANERLERQLDFVAKCDSADPRLPWDHTKEYYPRRIAAAMNFAAIHRGIRK